MISPHDVFLRKSMIARRRSKAATAAAANRDVGRSSLHSSSAASASSNSSCFSDDNENDDDDYPAAEDLLRPSTSTSTTPSNNNQQQQQQQQTPPSLSSTPMGILKSKRMTTSSKKINNSMDTTTTTTTTPTNTERFPRSTSFDLGSNLMHSPVRQSITESYSNSLDSSDEFDSEEFLHIIEKSSFIHKINNNNNNNNNNSTSERKTSARAGGPERRRGSIHHRQGRRDFDFLQDKSSEMTYSRRIALLLMAYPWYYPQNQSFVTTDDDDDDDYFCNNDNDTNDNNDNDDDDDDGYESSNERALSVFSFSIHKSTTFRKASLAKAWAYFEHTTLPRYICREEDMTSPAQQRAKDTKPQKKCFRSISSLWNHYQRHGCGRRRRHRRPSDYSHQIVKRAQPGEMHKYTRLYSPIHTPLSRMGDFGVGTGLYFTNLRALTVLTFVLGLINIPNMIYFDSEEYSGGHAGLFMGLQGSAICTRTEWVPCPDCLTTTSWETNLRRIAHGTLITTTTNNNTTTTTTTTLNNNGNSTAELLIFALRNTCDGAKPSLARINLVTIIILVIGLIGLGSYQSSWERKFEEGKETARDYSIVIENPPGDASDPDEWRHYFERTFRAKVALVTIGIDNDFLVRTLVQRREVLRQLELALDPGISMDVLSLAKLSSKLEHNRTSLQWLWHLTIMPGVPELFAKLTVLTARVQGLAQQKYSVGHVFVTFEKVTTRRRILREFCLGNLAIHGWMPSALKNKGHLIFRNVVLKVRHPDEPASIRWAELNANFKKQLLQLTWTNIINMGTIALFAYLIKVTYEFNYLLGVLFIATSNLVFVIFAKWLTTFESFHTEGDVQASIYIKVGIFRYVNTAIIINVIIPFTQTLEENGLIPTVAAVFMAELVTVNLTRLLDPIGNFKRHFLAPRARTQDAMNLKMRGTPVELAERVTDMTKMVFLAFWYSSIYPFGLFFCSFVLYVKYYTDRFGLMRSWKHVLPVGNRIAVFSRRYFISTAVVAFATISSYAWAGFPYDNLCENRGRVNTSHVGDWILERAGVSSTSSTDPEIIQVSVSASDSSYRYCLQDMLRLAFPAIPENQPVGGEWMTEEEVAITTIFGWTSVGCIAFVAIMLVWGWSDGVAELFYRKTEDNSNNASDEKKRPFHDVMDKSSINTYIPEVKSNLFPYPLVACDTDGIDDEIYTWTDPDHPHSYYDLTKDADFLTEGIGLDLSKAFSRMKHYRPEDTLPASQTPSQADDEEFQNEIIDGQMVLPLSSLSHIANNNTKDEYQPFLKSDFGENMDMYDHDNFVEHDYVTTLRGGSSSRLLSGVSLHSPPIIMNDPSSSNNNNSNNSNTIIASPTGGKIQKNASQRLLLAPSGDPNDRSSRRLMLAPQIPSMRNMQPPILAVGSLSNDGLVDNDDSFGGSGSGGEPVLDHEMS